MKKCGITHVSRLIYSKAAILDFKLNRLHVADFKAEFHEMFIKFSILAVVKIQFNSEIMPN